MRDRQFILASCVFLSLFFGCLRTDAEQKGEMDWPTWRGNAGRTASAQGALPSELKPLWARQLAQPAPAWPVSQHKIRFDESYYPVVAGKRVFISSMTTDSVTAYDSATGDEFWRFYCDGPVRFAPVVWKDNVYVVSDDGKLYCIAAHDGSLRWFKRGVPDDRKVLGNDRLISMWPARGAPVLVEEEDSRATLYFAAGIWPFMGIFIHALDPLTGDERWCNSGSGSIYVLQQHNSPAFAGVAPQGYLAVQGDTLLVSGGRTVPAAYNRHTGKFLYFEVAGREFGKEAGGYAVAAAGRDHFYNHSCLYNIKKGAPALNLAKKYGGTNIELIGGGIAIVSNSVLSWYQADPKTETKTVIDEKGIQKSGKEVNLPFGFTVNLGQPGARTHFRAGNRLFLSWPAGQIGSVEIPPSTANIWTARVEGEVAEMVPGDGKLFVTTKDGTIYCFGSSKFWRRTRAHPIKADIREQLPKIAGPKGYAVLWGLGQNAPARLKELARDYHVIGLCPDQRAVNELRRTLDDAGYYGHRIHLLAGELDSLALPPYFADLIDASNASNFDEALIEQAWRSVRPYGGRILFGEEQRALSESPSFKTADFVALAESSELDGLVLQQREKMVGLFRSGSLKGSAPWTHQHADVANSVLSDDELVKPPLGLLWFGGPPHDEILPRHGHGPLPQVVGGRLFIEGPDVLRAVDVYTGRMLWQRELPGIGAFYDNTSHQPGANEIGSNYVSVEDCVYVVYNKRCLMLDPATGKTLREFALPHSKGEQPHWGFIGVYEDLLIAGASPLLIVEKENEGSGAKKTKALPEIKRNAQYASSSTKLFVLNRYDGRVLWERTAQQVFRHNAIIAARGKLFCIDGMSQVMLDLLQRRGEMPKSKASLLALDIRTGSIVWQSDDKVFGTWLGYSLKHDILLEAGSPARDRAKDEAAGKMAAYRGNDGKLLWRERFQYAGTPILHDDEIYTEQVAFNLLEGRPKTWLNPISGKPQDWVYTRNYGCNTPIGGRHMLLFRSAAAGFYDLTTEGGTGNWGGFKSGCTPNLIPADGILNAPDYTRTCTCSYQNQCSLALSPMDDVEMWTFQGYDKLGGPPTRFGINFGAPGDWPSKEGTLWLEHPVVGGKGPDLKLKVEGEARYFRRHSLEMLGEARQVTASGLEGDVRVIIPLKTGMEQLYVIKLFFAEPEASREGERVFDVLLQNEPVLEKLDLFAEAGARRLGRIYEFRNIVANENITIELRARSASSLPPVLCGVEVQRQEALRASLDIRAGLHKETVFTKAGEVLGLLSLTNITDTALKPKACASISGVSVLSEEIELEPRGEAVIRVGLPVEQLNSGKALTVTIDLGADFGRFHTVETSFDLEVQLPLKLEIQRQYAGRIDLAATSLLVDRPQKVTIEARLGSDQIKVEEQLLEGEERVLIPFVVSEERFGKDLALEATARWADASVSPVKGQYLFPLSYAQLNKIPLRSGAKKRAWSPAVILDEKSGLFPVEKREELRGTDDMRAEIDWYWDDEFLHIAARVFDDLHKQTRTEGGIWNGDALQLAIVPQDEDMINIVLALTKNGPEFWRYSGADLSLKDTSKWNVSRDDEFKITSYELSLPLEKLGVNREDDELFLMNIVVFDDDTGAGFKYWRQLTPGLAGGHDVVQYQQFTLSKEEK